MSHAYTFKYILVGDPGVGKSCLLLQFTDNRFQDKLGTTIGVEFGVSTVSVRGKSIKLNVWDTAGQEHFRSVTRTYYRAAAGALLVYDITSRTSFEHVASWIAEAREHGNPNTVMMLVGNKNDMEARREVPHDEAAAYAKQHGLIFIETSARTACNVKEAFTRIATQIYDDIQEGKYDLSGDSQGIRLGPSSGKGKSSSKSSGDGGGGCCR